MTAARPARRRRAQRGSGEQLRAEIVAATKELLATSGSADAVSIRAVADKVGVTSPSIYLHFADKAELLSAVVVDVFRELDEAMLAAATAEDTPMGRLRAYGLAYIEFATSHPEHYRIAVMDPTSESQAAMDEMLRHAAFGHFNACVVDCMQAGIFRGDDPLPLTFQLWSAAHGVASLMIAKPHLPWGDAMTFADHVLCSAALGLAIHGRIANPDGSLSHEQVTAWLAEQSRRDARTKRS